MFHSDTLFCLELTLHLIMPGNYFLIAKEGSLTSHEPQGLIA